MHWPKGANTPDEMKELLDYLEKATGKEQLQPHPFFGNLNRKEWASLIYKHLDHHLKQFSSL